MRTRDLLNKANTGEVLAGNDLIHLLDLPPDSAACYEVLAAAAAISKELTGGEAEIHAQFAVNLAPCPGECLFCSFAKVNGVFHTAVELSPEQSVRYAQQFEADGANAVFMMATARYPFAQFVEVAQEVRRNLAASTTMVANVGDQSYADALRLKDAGFSGVYHALRLREGSDTHIAPERRRQSLRNFQEAGLAVGTCVEPVGPEHSSQELAAMIEFTASIAPCYSGAARRIPIPGTAMAKRGAISELRMAQIVAVTRLGMPRSVRGNCTHEPCTLGAIAGANLFWAEVGANPRDTREKTEDSRGETVSSCNTLFRESGWKAWQGPSRFYADAG